MPSMCRHTTRRNAPALCANIQMIAGRCAACVVSTSPHDGTPPDQDQLGRLQHRQSHWSRKGHPVRRAFRSPRPNHNDLSAAGDPPPAEPRSGRTPRRVSGIACCQRVRGHGTVDHPRLSSQFVAGRTAYQLMCRSSSRDTKLAGGVSGAKVNLPVELLAAVRLELRRYLEIRPKGGRTTASTSRWRHDRE